MASPCRFFATAGGCRYGDACHFSHIAPERIMLCKYFAAGKCKFGARCSLRHDADAAFSHHDAWERKREFVENVHDGVACLHEDESGADARGQARRDRVGGPDADLIVVIDLEGRDEIIQFPALVLNARTLTERGRFGRWVRPARLFQDVTDSSAVDNERSAAVPFGTVLADFGAFMDDVTNQGELTVLVATCGDWDMKQIARQCEICGDLDVPVWSLRWLNVKDLYAEVTGDYKHGRGMAPIMNRLGLELEGDHHMGTDDVENIARILIELASFGGILTIPTAARESPGDKFSTFYCTHRLKHNHNEAEIASTTTTETMPPAEPPTVGD